MSNIILGSYASTILAVQVGEQSVPVSWDIPLGFHMQPGEEFILADADPSPISHTINSPHL